MMAYTCYSMVLALLSLIFNFSIINGVQDFPVYRMQHLDLHGSRFGSRSAVVNMEARGVNATILNRKCVILHWTNLTYDTFNNLISRGAGALLLLLQKDWTGQNDKTVVEWMQLEKQLLSNEFAIPVYFTFENKFMTEVLATLSNSINEETSAVSAFISSVAGQGYAIIADATEAAPINDIEILTFVGKLTGQAYEADLPTLVLLSHYDTFGLAPSLGSNGDSAGSGVAAILELTRIFSIMYSDPLYRPQYNLLFVLTGGGKFNYFGTKYFIDDMLEDSDGFLLTEADYVLCLDAMAGGSELFLHVSKPPKDESKASKLIYLMNMTSGLINDFSQITLIHKKIRIGEEMLAWEHERFSFKRISAATISHYRHHNDPQRTSMFHMKTDVDLLYRNVMFIGEVIARHILPSNSTVNYSNPLLSGKMSVRKESVKMWFESISKTTRFLHSLNKEHPMIISIHQTLSRYVHELSTFSHKPDNNDPEFVLYTQLETVMHSYRIKPAVFDLILALFITLYVMAIYFFSINFMALQSCVYHFLSSKHLKGE